jgi:hypothetical protein
MEWDATGAEDIVTMVKKVGCCITIIEVAETNFARIAAIANAMGHMIRRRTAVADAASAVATGVAAGTVTAMIKGAVMVVAIGHSIIVIEGIAETSTAGVIHKLDTIRTASIVAAIKTGIVGVNLAIVINTICGTVIGMAYSSR